LECAIGGRFCQEKGLITIYLGEKFNYTIYVFQISFIESIWGKISFTWQQKQASYIMDYFFVKNECHSRQILCFFFPPPEISIFIQ
jgi:hypothetical protein